jgi:hypothetical protein
VAHLLAVVPLTDVIVEDVNAQTRKGKKRTWNAVFSPVQVGKHHLYDLLTAMGLTLHLKEGWQTKVLREKHGLTKTKSKSKQSFDSHALDSWVLAASISGACQPTCQRLWYLVPAQLKRRQLHKLQAAKGGVRRPEGSTRSLGFKRGIIVVHPKYGRCTVGGFDRHKQTISLHEYRTNKRLTQGARVKECRVLTWVAWRSWLIREKKSKGRGQPIPFRYRFFGGFSHEAA